MILREISINSWTIQYLVKQFRIKEKEREILEYNLLLKKNKKLAHLIRFSLNVWNKQKSKNEFVNICWWINVIS